MPPHCSERWEGGGGGGAWGGLSYECDRDARQIEDRIRVFMAWANPYEQ